MKSSIASVCWVMSLCLIMATSASAGEDVHTLARLGGQMDQDEKASLEEQVAKNPGDIESRTKLLGYYFIKGRHDADAKTAKRRHIVWFIENAPEAEVLGLPYGELDEITDPEGYRLAKQAWLRNIKKSPDKTSLLKNASRFFLFHDRKTSEELLLKGQKLDAKDPYWPSSLGQLYSLEIMRLPMGPERKATAEKAFRQFELAYKLSGDEEKDGLLSYLAKTALAAGLKDEAKKYGEKMLDDDAPGWNRGNRIHHGNLTLGSIALMDGDVEEAKKRLLLAGKTPGSPQLNSFGPNMALAKELLERGESEVVLEYFELCKKFWDSPRRGLEQWTEDVKANRIPQFGGNLAY